MTRVSMKDFSFRYRKNQRDIISQINLSFSTNEKILILGPSGGGKSTLLLTLLRLYTAFDIYYTKGKIYYDNRSGEELSRKDIVKLFGVVFQSPAHQFCLHDPDKEAAFGLENLQVEPSKMKGLIDYSFNHFGFDKRDHIIQNLSGGEQQILAAASTTLLGSEMLIMDEPTAHLDPAGRREFRKALHSWLGKNKGFILVEHHIDLWLDLIERVIILDDKGKIIFDEQGIEVLSREKKLLSDMGVWLPKQKIHSSKTGSEGTLKNRKEMNTEAVLEFKNASIGYNKKNIVKNLTMQVKKGEFVALAGRNGCGKSTLLQSIIGLSDLHKGNIEIDKKATFVNPPAYLFQNPEHQFIYSTVEEEIRNRAVPEGGYEQRVKMILESHGLYEKRKQNPFTLSGGEKRRLSLISLLSKEHSLYLLDEPTFGQDSKTAEKLVQTIKELHLKKKTIVIVSHDLSLFKEMLGRIIILNEGSLVFDGPPCKLSDFSEEQMNHWGVEL